MINIRLMKDLWRKMALFLFNAEVLVTETYKNKHNISLSVI